MAAELGLVMITLPLLLLGCGGGGSGSSSASPGIMTGQFWTDLTGAGITEFWPGSHATASSVSFPAGANIDTATFSGGSYATTDHIKAISGVAWTTVSNTSYYLGSSGWTLPPNPWTSTATNASTFTITGINLGSATVTISTTNLSGTTIAASSMVPAIDSLGYASSVSPASATYPANSYAYTLSELDTYSTPAYWLYAQSSNEVSTVSGSSTPINATNFTTAKFAQHTTITDPICVGGWGMVFKAGTTSTYNLYGLVLNAHVPAFTVPSCQNASIMAPILGTYDLSFVTINGASVVKFSTPTGWFQTNIDFLGNDFISVLPTGTAYYGTITPAGTTTSTTYWLNKTAMYAAMNAWGATSPN